MLLCFAGLRGWRAIEGMGEGEGGDVVYDTAGDDEEMI